MKIISLLWAGATALALSSPIAAQCTPEPNTGCPGAAAPQCSGSSAVGGAFKFQCLNSGRADVQFMLIGLCAPSPAPVGQPLTCVTGPCNIGVRLGLAVAINTNFNSVVVQIPNNPGLVGLNVCLQCVEIILAQACLTLSQAVRVVIT